MVAPSSARITQRRLYGLRKLSLIGFIEVVLVSFNRWNRGDSLSKSRIYSEMATRKIEIRNGIRHPKEKKASSPNDWRVIKITASDRNRPNVAVVWIQLVYRPRLPW